MLNLSRRSFLYLPAGAALAAPRLTRKQRVDRALRGQDVDRPPFSFWHHFLDAGQPGERHAKSTLEFHRKFRTDIVKVMSDYPYPKPEGQWYDLTVLASPFPEQLRALEEVRDGLAGEAYFIETMFNSWQVAEKLSSPGEVRRTMAENPSRLLAALEAISESQANHARKAVAAGASGIFLSITNAQTGVLTPAEYAKFSLPFDRMIFDAAPAAPLNALHLHGDKVYFEPFYKGWHAGIINYSAHGTGVSVADLRAKYEGVIMAGLDETNYRKLTAADLKQQAGAARQAAGRRFILAPGCSVPNDSTDEELNRLPKLLGA